jgi:hypothetical protein
MHYKYFIYLWHIKDSVVTSEYDASNIEIISEQWIGKDLEESDLHNFWYHIGMCLQNLRTITNAYQKWQFRGHGPN